MCLAVFLMFLMIWLHWLTWICGFIDVMKLENFLTIIYFLRYLLSSHLLSFDDANSTFIRPLEIVFTEPLFLFPSIFFFFLKFWVSNLLGFLFGSFLYLLIPLSSIILNILVFFFFFPLPILGCILLLLYLPGKFYWMQTIWNFTFLVLDILSWDVFLLLENRLLRLEPAFTFR